jgi:hypothetical protein
MIKPGWKVLSRNGTEIGTVGRVLADDGADIFHGIALKHGLPRVSGEREVLAAQIEQIVEDAVWTTLDPADVDKLPPAR